MEGFMEALFFQPHLPSPETLLYAGLLPLPAPTMLFIADIDRVTVSLFLD